MQLLQKFKCIFLTVDIKWSELSDGAATKKHIINERHKSSLMRYSFNEGNSWNSLEMTARIVHTQSRLFDHLKINTNCFQVIEHSSDGNSPFLIKNLKPYLTVLDYFVPVHFQIH